MTFSQAADYAYSQGHMTAKQYAELQKVRAIDWSSILSLLPMLATFFPPLAPFMPLIQWILPFILQIINKTPGPVPIPPLPTPPNGGGGDIPDPK